MSDFSDPMMDPYGLPPELIAQLIGQQYNPSQGYPLKQVSDQAWDYYGPTPDYLVQQQANFMTPWRDKFSTDAFFAADPLVRGGIAEGLAQSKGDTIGAYNYLQSPEYQDRLRQEIGRTEWDDLVGQGDLRSIAAVTGQERDDAAVQFYNKALEQAMAGGAPTSARNQAQYDAIAQRMGGRTYPGAGQVAGAPELQGSDPLASLMNSTPLGQDSSMLQSWRGGRDAPEPATPAVAARNATPDMDATREGGGGMTDLGETTGPDRLTFVNGRRRAVIDGRLYELDDTLQDASGSNPYYNTQLRAVMSQRAQRVREANDYGNVDRSDDPPPPGSVGAARDQMRSGVADPTDEGQATQYRAVRGLIDAIRGQGRTGTRASRDRAMANQYDREAQDILAQADRWRYSNQR